MARLTREEALRRWNSAEAIKRTAVAKMLYEDFRVEQNKTRKWLAYQLGKSTGTVNKWYPNTIQPDLKALNEIVNLLKVDVNDLLVSNI